MYMIFRNVGQAVSRRLPTAASRVRALVVLQYYDGQVESGAGFLRIILFPCQSLIS
jgi:hypothetical protein